MHRAIRLACLLAVAAVVPPCAPGSVVSFTSGTARADDTTVLPPAKAPHKARNAAAAPKTPPAKPPAVPAAPPPAPVLPPPIVVPTRPAAPPPPPVVNADAPGQATADKSGLRVTFGAGRSDLNPATESAIRNLVRNAPPFAGVTFTIVATAQGSEDDPSTPRRLSLARALAIRSVLISEGIAAPRITAQALGATPSAIADGPPDRVDIKVAGAPANPSQAGQPAPGATPPAGGGGRS